MIVIHRRDYLVLNRTKQNFMKSDVVQLYNHMRGEHDARPVVRWWMRL
jgi:hypothetical protein